MFWKFRISVWYNNRNKFIYIWQFFFLFFSPYKNRWVVQITSDLESMDQASHSMSFISDANVHALHRLLWNHQEKIGDYLSSSRDHKAVGRRPFDKMATLLAYLGPPEHKPVDSQYVIFNFVLLYWSILWIISDIISVLLLSVFNWSFVLIFFNITSLCVFFSPHCNTLQSELFQLYLPSDRGIFVFFII